MGSQKTFILAVDDEADMLETYRSILGKKFELLTAASGRAALEILKNKQVPLLLLDMKMPGLNGLEVLKKIKETESDTDVIMITASKEVASAVEAMKSGAFDYLTKPFDVKELLIVIDKALEKRELIKENLYLKETLKNTTEYCDLIGRTPGMKKLFETIEKVAPTDSTVLIHGESGTGKELVARAIHKKSKRAHRPFVAVNCAAIPENLLESELFGHERGSFTGASERKLGKFELADSGSLFLDEIGCMSAAMQAKLLRVLEDKVIERLGGEKGVPVDVRIISATNIDFQKEIKEGKFRHDLYYRLNVIPINLIPLRERKEDIPLFVDYFLNKFNKELNKKVNSFSAEALKALMGYDWPGNVRELQNLVERGVVLANGREITPDDLPFSPSLKIEAAPIDLDAGGTGNLHKTLEHYEKELIVKALAESGQNRTKAAQLLGIARSSLNSKIEALGLS
ncbi:MAG: sigma-54 dependent transcriptional regulator [Candidatus Margulisbacteria bacterium]|nr:sigma-54 dependent transcriptional regulator [Candidatus Margulisiibacteriota bacterium]